METPPITNDVNIDKHGQVSTHNVEVQADIIILEVIDINMENSFINVLFRYTLKWKDERIRFNFLKNNERKNLITSKAMIWKPRVNFMILEDQKDQKALSTETTVKKEGKPSISSNKYTHQFSELLHWSIFWCTGVS